MKSGFEYFYGLGSFTEEEMHEYCTSFMAYVMIIGLGWMNDLWDLCYGYHCVGRVADVLVACLVCLCKGVWYRQRWDQ